MLVGDKQIHTHRKTDNMALPFLPGNSFNKNVSRYCRMHGMIIHYAIIVPIGEQGPELQKGESQAYLDLNTCSSC